MPNYNKIAQKLDEAAFSATAIPQLSLSQPLNLAEAYAVQSISIARRYRRGEQWKGLKLGFTSKAKMEQMGVHDMIWGRLTDKMYHENQAQLRLTEFIHPRAEPEIAFLIKKDIPHALDLTEITTYIKGVAVAIEIIDSRYENFKFSLEDVIADNCSSAAFTIGEWKSPETPVQDLAISLQIDGNVIHQGNSNAILGNPLESLVAATRLATENGVQIPAGAIILAGAATPAVYLEAGQLVEAEATTLGKAGLHTI